MAIESIQTSNNFNSNPIQQDNSYNSVVTETIDLEAMALNAYNEEIAKYQSKLDTAQIMYNNAKTELENYRKSAANLSSGSVKTTINYDNKSLSNLMEAALEQLSSNMTK